MLPDFAVRSVKEIAPFRGRQRMVSGYIDFRHRIGTLSLSVKSAQPNLAVDRRRRSQTGTPREQASNRSRCSPDAERDSLSLQEESGRKQIRFWYEKTQKP